MVESREPRACRNHVSSPARKNTGDFTPPLLEVHLLFLSFFPFLFDSWSRIAICSINFYRYPPPSSASSKNLPFGSRFDDRFFFLERCDGVRKRRKRGWWTRGGADGGEGGWNCENRHAHARDTHVRSTRHAAEHYGFRRPISTSRTDETRRKQPIARPRPDRKENPSRLIPRFRKRWRDSTLFFFVKFDWGWWQKRSSEKLRFFRERKFERFFFLIYWNLRLTIIMSYTYNLIY